MGKITENPALFSNFIENSIVPPIFVQEMFPLDGKHPTFPTETKIQLETNKIVEQIKV